MWKIESQSKFVGDQHEMVAGAALSDLLSRKDVGFFQIDRRREELSRIQELASRKRGKFEHIAVLGIGGSALGTVALFDALLPDWIENKKIIFFDNVDSKSFYRKLRGIPQLEKTLWVLVSKSGSTIETLTQAECVNAFFHEKGLEGFSKNCVVITEEKTSDLYDWAVKNNVETLPVPLNVGGRFSVLTAVGLFPAVFAGMDVDALLKGAEASLENKDIAKNMMKEYIASVENKAQVAYFFSYCDDLKSFGLWTEQLWAESLGKKESTSGGVAPMVPAPMACRGSTDQHSVLQQMAHGQQKKVATFLRVGEAESVRSPIKKAQFTTTQNIIGKSLGQLLRAEAMATEQALVEEDVQAFSIYTDKLNAQSLGFLFMTLELVVAGLGFALGVNPFDQPGVERGKVLARTILTQ
jgi:glucose-6-phosphate isomerase